ncbi:MAG: SLOG family protein [Patescibacteria group bacterium]
MYKIGIIGHSPENFSIPSKETVKNMINDTISLLASQYNTDVIFNIIGEIGVGLWAVEEVLNIKGAHKYHIYLPFTQEITSEDWYDEQKELLKKGCDNARSITICNSKKTPQDEQPYRPLIQDSNFIIYFWNGKKQGKTFDAIKYALETNKMALNALNDLKLITNKNI